jgi:hypothetical protein
MLRKLFFFVLIAFCTVSTVQAQDYLTKIAEGACSCLSKLDPKLKGLDAQNAIGTCLMSASQPYVEQLKKDHKIDLVADNMAAGQKLGQLVAVKMLATCQPVMLGIINRMSDMEVVEVPSFSEDDMPALDVEIRNIAGTVVSVDAGQFLVIEIKDETANYKLFMIDPFDTDLDMSKYKELVGKKISCDYFTRDVLDYIDNGVKEIRVIESISLVK